MTIKQIKERIEEVAQARNALCVDLNELYANKELQAQYKAYTKELEDLFAEGASMISPV